MDSPVDVDILIAQLGNNLGICLRAKQLILRGRVTAFLRHGYERRHDEKVLSIRSHRTPGADIALRRSQWPLLSPRARMFGTTGRAFP